MNKSDEHIACLLQCLHNADVPEDVRTDVLQDPIVQIAFTQVLNELDIVTTQQDDSKPSANSSLEAN